MLVTSRDPVVAQNEKNTSKSALTFNSPPKPQCWVIALWARAAHLRALWEGRNRIPSSLQSWQGKRNKQTNRKAAPSWSRSPGRGEAKRLFKALRSSLFQPCRSLEGKQPQMGREGVAARPVIIRWSWMSWDIAGYSHKSDCSFN